MLISLGVLGIGAVALVNLFTSTASGVRRSRNDTRAEQLAIQRLEVLTSQGVEQLPACGGVPSCRAGHAEFAPPMSSANGYECSQVVDDQYRIDTVVSAPADARQRNGARVVRINVCWWDGRAVKVSHAERLMVPEA